MNRLLTLCCLASLLGGCASPPEQQVLQATLQARLPAPPASAPLPSATDTAPLSQDAALRLALAHSPALQALIASSQAQQSQSLARARPGLLGFTLERSRQGDDRSLSRTLTLGLLDLLTWPLQSAQARREVEQQQIDLARQVMGHLHDTRVQWVRAVAARERALYLTDVLTVTQTGAELARRMQEAGHFSALQATQSQLQAAQARTALAQARQHALMEREALIRLLGLEGAQAEALSLPDRLPGLPDAPPASAAPDEDSLNERLDVRLALARWQARQSGRTATALGGVVDVELGAGRTTGHGEATEHSRELGVHLSALDLGAARRSAASSSEDAARLAWLAARQQARSEWRSALAQRQSAHDVAMSARQELLPLHQRLVAERLKQYNGMLIGPFELLAQARQYRDSVVTALEAQRDYWLAEAQVQATREGSATGLMALGAGSTGPAAPSTEQGH